MIDMKLDASVTIRDRIDDLYRSDSRRVFASLVRLLKDFDLADDAMHEAYAAAVAIWQRDGRTRQLSARPLGTRRVAPTGGQSVSSLWHCVHGTEPAITKVR